MLKERWRHIRSVSVSFQVPPSGSVLWGKPGMADHHPHLDAPRHLLPVGESILLQTPPCPGSIPQSVCLRSGRSHSSTARVQWGLSRSSRMCRECRNTPAAGGEGRFVTFDQQGQSLLLPSVLGIGGIILSSSPHHPPLAWCSAWPHTRPFPGDVG